MLACLDKHNTDHKLVAKAVGISKSPTNTLSASFHTWQQTQVVAVRDFVAFTR